MRWAIHNTVVYCRGNSFSLSGWEAACFSEQRSLYLVKNCTCACPTVDTVFFGYCQKKRPKAPLPPSQVSFSKTCHWLFGICRNSRYADNLSSHWQISVFRLGETTHLRTQAHMHTRTHKHAHLGLAVLLLLACQRPTPVNSNKSLWPAMLIATWPTKEIDLPEDGHIADTRGTLEDTFKFKLLTQAFLPQYVLTFICLALW